MNLVGKIFTVLIFLMCVVFGTFALMVHAAHKNWRDVVILKGGLNDQLLEAKKTQEELREQKKNLETEWANEKDRTRRRVTALEQAAKDAIAAQNREEKDLQVQIANNRELTLAIKETTQHIAVLQTAIDSMRADIKVAIDERNNLQKKLVDKTDELMNNVAERTRLEKLQRDLSAQILKMQEALQYAKVALKGAPVDAHGEVTAVPRPDEVEISLGADDGVRKGHKFVVTRPSTGKYIGMIDVIRVDYPNRAVCRPDKATQSDQIQKGDHVDAYTKVR